MEEEEDEVEVDRASTRGERERQRIKALVARVVDESEEAFKVRTIDFVARF